MSSETDDDALLDLLRRVVAEADPMPDTVLAAADAAIETRDFGARLATLIADSARPDLRAALAQVRHGQPEPADERVLVYDGGGVQIDVAVRSGVESLMMLGRITGASIAEARLERADGRSEFLDPDEMGRFVLGGIVPGPFRLRCRSTAGYAVVTEWIRL